MNCYVLNLLHLEYAIRVNTREFSLKNVKKNKISALLLLLRFSQMTSARIYRERLIKVINFVVVFVLFLFLSAIANVFGINRFY